MENEVHSFLSHLKPLWFLVTAAAGFVLAFIYALRYKFPDMGKRITSLEKKAISSLVNNDLQQAIDGFHTVCRFNQVSCQKENEANLTKLMADLDKKIGALYDKLNDIALCNAKLATKVDLLIADRDNGNGGIHKH